MTDQTSDQPELTPQEQKILSESPADSPNIIDGDTEDDGGTAEESDG